MTQTGTPATEDPVPPGPPQPSPRPARAVRPSARDASAAARAKRPLTLAGKALLGLLTVVALALGWRVLTLGLSDRVVDSDPEQAAAWRNDNPDALLNAANAAWMRHDFAEAKKLSIEALARYPLEGGAYGNLARDADFFHDQASAQRYLQLAVRYAPRDLAAREMLANYALRKGKVDEALAQIDTMLHMYPEVLPQVMPTLVQLSAFRAAQQPIAKLLARRPRWRTAFLSLLASAGSDPDGVDRIFSNRGGDDPLPALPPQSELTPVDNPSQGDEPTGFTESDLLINRQLADGRWDVARATWVASLTPGERAVLGNLYDGDFVFPPTFHPIAWLGLSRKGFGWQLPDSGSGFDMRFTPRTANATQNVLRVMFNGLPVDYTPLSQLLVLKPGHYRFQGMGQAGGMTREEGFRWVVACVQDPQASPSPDGERLLGQSSPFMGDVPYGPFSFEFDVPGNARTTTTTAGSAGDPGCGAQQLRLDLGSGLYKGIPLQGGVLFDHLRIERLGDLAPARADAADARKK